MDLSSWSDRNVNETAERTAVLCPESGVSRDDVSVHVHVSRDHAHTASLPSVSFPRLVQKPMATVKVTTLTFCCAEGRGMGWGDI